LASKIASTSFHHLYEIFGLSNTEQYHGALDIDLKGHNLTIAMFEDMIQQPLACREEVYQTYLNVDPAKLKFIVLTSNQPEKDIYSAHIIEHYEGYYFKNIKDLQLTIQKTNQVILSDEKYKDLVLNHEVT
jgi:hypothetical protein